MLRLKLTDKIIGMYIAKPIYDIDGKLLISQETVLTEPMLRNLKAKKINFVYVDIFPDLQYDDRMFPDNQKILLLNSIFQLHNRIKEFIPLVKDQNNRDQIFRQSEAISRDVFKIVTPLIDTVFYLDDTALNNFIEYRFMFPFSINKIILNLIYASYIAKSLKLNNSEIEKLASAIILIDIGFYTLPEEYTDPNYYYIHSDVERIKKHPAISFEILRNIIGFDTVTASLTYMSHERIDGSGYPRKLKGDEINILAQIIGIIDTFTELKYSPKYKSAVNPELLYSLLSSKKFDKKLSDIFISSIPPFQIGTTVFLNNGELGVVTGFEKNFQFRPSVRKIDAGNLYDNIVEYNLKNDDSINITGYVW